MQSVMFTPFLFQNSPSKLKSKIKLQKLNKNPAKWKNVPSNKSSRISTIRCQWHYHCLNAYRIASITIYVLSSSEVAAPFTTGLLPSYYFSPEGRRLLYKPLLYCWKYRTHLTLRLGEISPLHNCHGEVDLTPTKEANGLSTLLD